MNEGILGAIANPQLADVAGALDYRRAQIDKDEAKRKELRMNQLIAQAIPNMAADSPIREIFENDPKMGAAISKAYGIPLNDGEAWEKMRSNVAQLHSLAKADPRMAIERANAMKAENDRLGIIDAPLNKWVGGVNSAMEKGDQDGVITLFNSLGVTNDNLNPVKADVISAEKKEEFRIKEKELDWKMSQPEGGGENAGVQSSNILDDGTVIQVLKSGGTRVVDPAGNVLSGAARAEAIKSAQNYGIDIQSARAGGRAGEAERAKGNVGRSQEFINQGVTSAQALPTIKRSMDLLNSIETGGIDAARIKAKQMFGIESADEGELTYNLGKNVLSQLKDTFGSAFTAAEGERLATLEAGLGRNPESNKRILANALQTMQKKAERGIQAARDNGDEFSASDIESYMKMSLGDENKTKSQKSNALDQNGGRVQPIQAETAAQRLARLTSGK